MSVSQRLAQYIIASGLNINQVTVRCRLTPGALNKAIKAGKGLHSDTIAAVMREYRDLNPDWLLLGDGEMFRPWTELPIEQDLQNPVVAAVLEQTKKNQADAAKYLASKEGQAKLAQAKEELREKHIAELEEALYVRLRKRMSEEEEAAQKGATSPKDKKKG